MKKAQKVSPGNERLKNPAPGTARAAPPAGRTLAAGPFKAAPPTDSKLPAGPFGNKLVGSQGASVKQPPFGSALEARSLENKHGDSCGLIATTSAERDLGNGPTSSAAVRHDNPDTLKLAVATSDAIADPKDRWQDDPPQGEKSNLLLIGDVIHFMHARKKGPPQVLKESFGVIVTEELVVPRRPGDKIPEEAFGVVDLRSGELVRRTGSKMVKVERFVRSSGDISKEPGRLYCSVLDFLELQLPCVSEHVREMFLEVEPIPRVQLEALIITENSVWKQMLLDRKHVRRIISMVMTRKHNTSMHTWKRVTALGKVFLEKTSPENMKMPGASAAETARSSDACRAEYDAALLEFDEGPSFDELLAELKAEARALKGL